MYVCVCVVYHLTEQHSIDCSVMVIVVGNGYGKT